MLSEAIIKDAESQPQTLQYRINNPELLRLEDQEEILALNNPRAAYKFAIYVRCADIKRCRAICKGTRWNRMINNFTGPGYK